MRLLECLETRKDEYFRLYLRYIAEYVSSMVPAALNPLKSYSFVDSTYLELLLTSLQRQALTLLFRARNTSNCHIPDEAIVRPIP